MNGHYYYSNPGAALRLFFPKQLNTQTSIIIWTIIFVLNIIIVVLVQNTIIYPIADFSVKGLQEISYFKECKVNSANIIERNGDYSRDYCVKYTNEEGELCIVCLDSFPGGWFERARIMKETDMLLLEGDMVQYKAGKEVKIISQEEYFEITNPSGFMDKIVGYGKQETMVGFYVAIGAGMLLLEFFLYGVFHRLFRE